MTHFSTCQQNIARFLFQKSASTVRKYDEELGKTPHVSGRNMIKPANYAFWNMILNFKYLYFNKHFVEDQFIILISY